MDILRTDRALVILVYKQMIARAGRAQELMVRILKPSGVLLGAT